MFTSHDYLNLAGSISYNIVESIEHYEAKNDNKTVKKLLRINYINGNAM